MMENKVWDILKNQKEIYTEEGQKNIEQCEQGRRE